MKYTRIKKSNNKKEQILTGIEIAGSPRRLAEATNCTRRPEKKKSIFLACQQMAKWALGWLVPNWINKNIYLPRTCKLVSPTCKALWGIIGAVMLEKVESIW